MEGLSNLDATLYVLDPHKKGVRYDVVRQIAYSYSLINRYRGKSLSFIAVGTDAEKAHEVTQEIFTLPILQVCTKYANLSAYSKAMSTKQIPHDSEPVPEIPGALGPLLKRLYEFGEWGERRLEHQKKTKPMTIVDQWRKWGWHGIADYYEKEMLSRDREST